MNDELSDEKKISSKRKLLKKLIPLLVIIFFAIFLYIFGFNKYITFENLKDYHTQLTTYARIHPVLSVVIYMVLYFFGTAFLLPEMIILTLLGGLLFPFPWSVVYTIFPATLGACSIFFIAETSIGKYLSQKASGKLKKMQKGFQKDATNYLLFLRLLPLFPFWLVNIAPAIFNIRLWTFTWTTFVGVIPGTAVFCYAGNSLNSIFINEEVFSIRSFFSGKIIIALLVLSVGMIIPVIIKHKKNKKKNEYD